MSNPEITQEWFNGLRRPASLATIGGFRPPADPLTSWFIRGVGLPGEELPQWNGTPMFPLLQIRVDELPVVPERLRRTAMLVMFFNQEEVPVDAPHGEGWLIREYPSLDRLRPLPAIAVPYTPLPIKWDRIENDFPSQDDVWELMDADAIGIASLEGLDIEQGHHGGTKVGGYPSTVQGEVGIKDFVLQVDSDQKVGWDWIDFGIAYFHCAEGGDWRFSCQFL